LIPQTIRLLTNRRESPNEAAQRYNPDWGIKIKENRKWRKKSLM